MREQLQSEPLAETTVRALIRRRAENQKNRQSVGIKNVRERLKTLCGGELIFESSDAGTTVTITIPKSDTKQS